MLDKIEVGKTYETVNFLNTILFIGKEVVLFEEVRKPHNQPYDVPRENTWTIFAFKYHNKVLEKK